MHFLFSSSIFIFYWNIVDLQSHIKFRVYRKLIQLYLFFFQILFLDGY